VVICVYKYNIMKQWKVAENSEAAADLAKQVGVSDTISQLLINRGLTDFKSCQEFLFPKRKFLLPPHFLPDLEKAALRIRKAIESREQILLFGDYDVDGVTSLAMLADYLSKRGVNFKVLIPSRVQEGYGFNQQALKLAESQGISLIIALDCGTNSLLIDKARSKGVDVIVVDHHQVFERKRNHLLVNPKRRDSDYPFKEVTTGVLVFKLVWALKNIFPYEYLDLVSLSIVCDVAPLVGENRILVKEGLGKLRSSPCLGVESLMRASSVRKEYIDTFHLGWALGPRLNASGRLALAYPSFQLLSVDSEEEAEELARLLDKNNKQRQAESRNLLNLALAKIDSEVDLRNDYVIVLSEEDWHIGILGIVASRIKEKFSRPTFLISLKQNAGKGSGRSIEGFHLMGALDKCKGLLKGYGGHSKACGIEIEKSQIDNFRKAINSIAKEALKEKDLIAKVFIDRQICFSQINPQMMEHLEFFSPFGEANPEPLFLTRSLKVKNITDYKQQEKLIWFQEDTSENMNFVYPAQVSGSDKIFTFLDYARRFDIIYNLRKERNRPDLQVILKLRDSRIS